MKKSAKESGESLETKTGDKLMTMAVQIPGGEMKEVMAVTSIEQRKRQEAKELAHIEREMQSGVQVNSMD